MSDSKQLKRIADLFGGVNKLAKEIGLDGSGVSRRIQGVTQITNRDWICIRAAVSKRVEELQAVSPKS